ncbi:endoplasmic reticulum-Golgi intermediate compartment protein 3-like [Panicum miliaceum]|uniref:Endoplasmic reticulum-Golgi intermediate compartment protein 3-like n=1 Tax=Panicum miliaceum TaxID=4540 RepID=A0A3L6T8X6_PANMI|nr:endoplasmic reticulum-Golgi intermediate compartment protein 3-like [Panicum miliaceum]
MAMSITMNKRSRSTPSMKMQRKWFSVKQAPENGEGCRVYGMLDVQTVAGNFHISVHGLNVFVAEKVCRCIASELKQAESGGSAIPGNEAHMRI